MDLSEENIVNIVKKPSNKKNEGKLKRRFPKINKCCCCPCMSLDLAIKITTMLLMIWFIIVIVYNCLNGVFNIGIVLYMIVVLSALVFFIGIVRLRLVLLNQYLIVLLVFLIYYIIFCIYTVIAAIAIPSYVKDLEDIARSFSDRSTTIDELNARLNYIRIFLMVYTFIPFFIYLYYFLAVGSYVDLIKEHVREEILTRELEEDIH